MLTEGPASHVFNDHGEFLRLVANQELYYFDALSYDTEADIDIIIDDCAMHCMHRTTIKTKEPNYSDLQL